MFNDIEGSINSGLDITEGGIIGGIENIIGI